MPEDKKMTTQQTKSSVKTIKDSIKKTAAVKKSSEEKAVSKKIPVKKAATKSAATKKTPVKKAATKSAATKKAPVKKAATKLATTKKVTTKQTTTKSARTPEKITSIVYVPSLKRQYAEKIVPALLKRFNYKNRMEVPKLRVISLNMGIGDAKNNPKALESALTELSIMTGQKAVVTKSKKDISNFKVRKGFPVGCKVTLHANRMYEFLERLISIALPRTRDFTGLSFKSFDKRGNYSFGVKEQIVFTEIDYDKIDSIRGMDVTISTTAKTDDEAYWLLKEFGFPLRNRPVKTEVVEAV